MDFPPNALLPCPASFITPSIHHSMNSLMLILDLTPYLSVKPVSMLSPHIPRWLRPLMREVYCLPLFPSVTVASPFNEHNGQSIVPIDPLIQLHISVSMLCPVHPPLTPPFAERGILPSPPSYPCASSICNPPTPSSALRYDNGDTVCSLRMIFLRYMHF